MKLLKIILLLVTMVTIASIIFVYLRSGNTIGENTFFLSLAFIMFCFMAILIILSYAEFKKESIWNKLLSETTSVIVKEKEFNVSILINEYRDLRKQKYKFVLEIGKMKNKNERLNKEIDTLQSNLRGVVSDTDKEKSGEENLKRKQIELNENSIMLQEYQDHVTGITQALEELKEELNNEGITLFEFKKADRNL